MSTQNKHNCYIKITPDYTEAKHEKVSLSTGPEHFDRALPEPPAEGELPFTR